MRKHPLENSSQSNNLDNPRDRLPPNQFDGFHLRKTPQDVAQVDASNVTARAWPSNDNGQDPACGHFRGHKHEDASSNSKDVEPLELQGFQKNLAWLFLADGLDHLLDNQKLDTVNALANVTPKITQSVAWYVGRRINRAFAPWVDSPLKFRDVLRSTKSLVSGSLALHTIVAALWACDNMDVYAPVGTGGDAIIHHLRHQESYILVSETVTPHETSHPGAKALSHLICTTRLVRRVRTLQGEVVRYIDVHESCSDAAKPIAMFSTSLVMNWIGADEIMVLYPELTLAGEGVVNTASGADPERNILWMAKYAARGFTVVEGSNSRGDGLCNPFCRVRRLFDTGEDMLQAVATTHEPEMSPWGAWLQQGWRRMSNFQYTCRYHSAPGPPMSFHAWPSQESLYNHLFAYINYTAWDELD